MIFRANTAATSATDNAINIIDIGINAIDDEINDSAEVDVDRDIVNLQDYIKGDEELQLFSKNLNASEQNFFNAEISSKI